jgi:hypothetical protein
LASALGDEIRSVFRTGAAFLTKRGFDAEVVLDPEPDLPIAFVVVNRLNAARKRIALDFT